MPQDAIAWVECPRDAWQGLSQFIPTERKAKHLRRLLSSGFRRLDLGSFVSPRAVPQLADTEDVLARLDPPSDADLLCIVGNLRGVERAVQARAVTSVGYPLGISETFQRRNLGRSLEASWREVAEIAEAAATGNLDLVVYVSMGFGNPYGDPWCPADTAEAVRRLREIGVRRVAIADTVGTADAATVTAVLESVGEDASNLGLHLHARPDAWRSLMDAGLAAGIRWFEGALAGIGGCPFAGDGLVGNLPTERVLAYLKRSGYRHGIVEVALPDLAEEAAQLASRFA